MSTAESLHKGMKASTQRVVQARDLADSVGSGDLPVLATPIMAALMEEAAVGCVQPHLPAEQTTVGIALDISHLAATPQGAKVWAEAELTEIKGKKLVFEVRAGDARETIGQGTHTRVIVDRQSFMQRVQTKG